MSQTTRLRQLGLQDYQQVWRAMQDFTLQRTAETPDEIWITEHPPVYTLGLNGKAEHLLAPGEIPLVNTDRGGQVTYHGPGQLIVYLLADLKRLALGPRNIVQILENAVIGTLGQFAIKAHTRDGAPGVYIADKKISALGLRIKKGCCYHGLSLNNNMDLSPFLNINPCGYPGLEITQLAAFGIDVQNHELAVPLIHHILQAIET